MGQFTRRYRQAAEGILFRPLALADRLCEELILGKLCDLEFPLPEALVDFYRVLGSLDRVMRSRNWFELWEHLGSTWETNSQPHPLVLIGSELLIFLRADGPFEWCWGIRRDDLQQPNPPVFRLMYEVALEGYRLDVENNSLSDFLASVLRREVGNSR